MGPTRNRLNDYLSVVRDKPFEWGEHDCYIFTNNAWTAMYGRGYADDWVGKYMYKGKPVGAKTLKKRFGFDTLEEALDSKLQRIDYVPPVGSLVITDQAHEYATGAALGISLGVHAVYVGESGLVFSKIEHIKGAWVCHR